MLFDVAASTGPDSTAKPITALPAKGLLSMMPVPRVPVHKVRLRADLTHAFGPFVDSLPHVQVVLQAIKINMPPERNEALDAVESRLGGGFRVSPVFQH